MQKDRVSSEMHSPPKVKVKAASWPVAPPSWWRRSRRAHSPPVSQEASLSRGQALPKAGQRGGGANHAVGPGGLSHYRARGPGRRRAQRGALNRDTSELCPAGIPESPSLSPRLLHFPQSPGPLPSSPAPSPQPAGPFPRASGPRASIPAGFLKPGPFPQPPARPPPSLTSAPSPGKRRSRYPRARNRQRKCDETAAFFPFRDLGAPRDRS
uniref:Uncharacterized protein n=1 Tax=Rangifer tarandus platyrhynchus TaxID=3082113 RepID=A0ACB0EZ45_RANTA|nr:unnamed protein product [Rangifer tarandus platyrhynchus]